MRKINILITLALTLTLQLFAVEAFALGNRPPQNPQPQPPSRLPSSYEHLDPQGIVPRAALRRLVSYYDQVKNKIGNPYYLTVIDFSRHSSEKRMHVIDVRSGQVYSYLTSHGKGSDSNHDGFAEQFSNTSGSLASSLGIYRTGSQITSPKHGKAMLLYGLESTNSNALSREVIVHGASYVSPEAIAATGKIGRSFGCPAVEYKYISGLVDTLKNGSLLMVVR